MGKMHNVFWINEMISHSRIIYDKEGTSEDVEVGEFLSFALFHGLWSVILYQPDFTCLLSLSCDFVLIEKMGLGSMSNAWLQW